MSRSNVLVLVPVVLLAAGCAADRNPPRVLVDARADYAEARDGAAARLAPSELSEAHLALSRAEHAFASDPQAEATVDLAVIADRKALLAVAEAGTVQAQHEADQAIVALQTAREELQARRSRTDPLRDTLGRAEMQRQEQGATIAARRGRLQEMDADLRDARDAIANVASVADDDRGMVVTLPADLLFKDGKSELASAAEGKLDEIARALASKDEPIVVYGYTDDIGTREACVAQSESRARAVRDRLVSKGIPRGVIVARGVGPDNPVASNTSSEGRARNRRVEIVVEPKDKK